MGSPGSYNGTSLEGLPKLRKPLLLRTKSFSLPQCIVILYVSKRKTSVLLKVFFIQSLYCRSQLYVSSHIPVALWYIMVSFNRRSIKMFCQLFFLYLPSTILLYILSNTYDYCTFRKWLVGFICITANHQWNFYSNNSFLFRYELFI